MHIDGKEVQATTSNPVFAVDPEGKIIAWNEAAEYCLGYRRLEVLGRRCWRVLRGQDLSSKRDCDKTCAVLSMALGGEPIRCTQMAFRSATGETTQFDMSTLVVRGEKGKEIAHLLRCPPCA